MIETIQLRRDLAANWASVNPVLAQGEAGVETDTGKAKLGDGATAWSSLPYWNPSGLSGGGGGGAVASVFGRAGAVTAQSGDYTVSEVTGAAPLASPALTGTPAAPTASPLTDDTQVATTAYTDAAVAVETVRAEAAEALALPLAGGTMSGAIAMGSHKITGLTNGSAAQDAAAYGQTPAGGATVTIAQGGTGQTAQQAAMDALAGATTSGDYLRGNGSHVVMTAIQAADVPTLNQNTTGTASNITDTLDQVPAPAANVGLNSHKITGLANGAAAQDAAAFGQIPVSASSIGGLLAANNLSDVASASTSRTNLGLGSAATQASSAFAQTASNLSDLASASTARTNLGLTGAATAALPISIANGGTGQTGAAAAYNALSPMTTLGDLEYESGASTASRLAGNTSAAKQFLTQTGTGSASAAPAWGAILAGDVPTLNQNTTGSAGSCTGNAATATNLAGGAVLPDYLAPAVNALTFVASGTTLVNAALGNAFNLTLTASTTTLGNPSNPVDGQVIRFRITQGTGGSFTLAYGSAYDFGAGSAPTLSTAAAKVDILGFEYVASISKWCYLGSGLGF